MNHSMEKQIKEVRSILEAIRTEQAQFMTEISSKLDSFFKEVDSIYKQTEDLKDFRMVMNDKLDKATEDIESMNEYDCSTEKDLCFIRERFNVDRKQ